MSSYLGSWLANNGHKILYIHAKNRWEWTVCDIACIKYGIVTVALYDTLGKQALDHSLKLTQGKIIASTQETVNNLLHYSPNNINNIKTMILLESITVESSKKLEKLGIKTIHIEEILKAK